MSTGRLLVISSLIAGCAALLSTWLFVLRPAANDRNVIDAGTFLSDGTEQLLPDADPGTPAPDLALESFEGNTVSLESLRGKPIVLNFWATYCVPCITEMPMIESIHREYGDRVQFVGINVGETIEQATPQVESTGVTYPQLLDPDMEALGAFGAIALPHTVVIDANGTVVREKNLELKSADELREMIEEAF